MPRIAPVGDERDARLRTALESLADGRATGVDIALLCGAISTGQIKIAPAEVAASAERAVAVGGNASYAKIVTGDGNVLLSLENLSADAVRQLFEELHPPRLHQLPGRLLDFKGREEPKAKLLERLRSTAGHVVINGMGGTGKTALAVHIAHDLASDYGDAQLFLDLRGVSDMPVAPEDALRTFLHSFRPTAQLPEGSEELCAIYRSELSKRKALVVLDNAKDATQVRSLLPPAPSVAIITSRRAILLPGLQSLSLEKLEGPAALALLSEIIGAGSAKNEQLQALAQACTYLPLALRAAGSFLAINRDWSVPDYIKALTDKRQRIASLKGPDDPDLDVHAVLSLSTSQLQKEEPALAEAWCQLVVFDGTFDRAAVAAVWDKTKSATRDALSALMRRHMVEYDTGTSRYHLHDLMRDVAQQMIDQEHQSQALLQARLRHAAHYEWVLSVTGEFFRSNQGLLGLALYDQEAKNIAAAQKWAAGATASCMKLRELCSRFAKAGAFVLPLRLHPREWIGWLEAALEASRQARDSEGEADHLTNLGAAYNSVGLVKEAIRCHEKALAIARETGNRPVEGSAIGNLGNAYERLGETEKAIAYREESLVIAREIGDRWGEGNALGNLGLSYAGRRQFEKAAACHAQAVAIAQEVGDRSGEASQWGNLANAYAGLGEVARAVACRERALAIAREIGDRGLEGRQLGNLGNVYLGVGEAKAAIALYEQGLAIARATDDRDAERNCLANLGRAYSQLRDLQKAITCHDQALAIAREISDRESEADAFRELGLAYGGLGEVKRALAHHERALALSQEIGDRWGEKIDLLNLGSAHASLGDDVTAMACYERSLAIVREIGDREGLIKALNNLGNSYCRLGKADIAVTYHEQALAIAREIGDYKLESGILNTLGADNAALRKLETAIAFYKQALSVALEGDHTAKGKIFYNLALAYAELGEVEQAISCHEQAALNLEAIGSPEVARVRVALEFLKSKKPKGDPI